MPKQFREQLDLLDEILGNFYAGTVRVTLCVSSGISLGRMPSLHNLLSCALAGLPQTPAAEELFARYEGRYRFSDVLRGKGIEFEEPLTIQTFCGLAENIREEACRRLANDYGDIFHELEGVFGSKQSLLMAINFERFQNGDPDASHQYIAYLYIEGRLQRVVSLNWDCLIEIAIQRVRSEMNLNVVRDEPSWVEMNAGPQEIIAKVHGCARQYPGQCAGIVISSGDVENATGKPWIQTLLQDFLNGFVLFAGYRARDTTLNVPLRSIERLRQKNALPAGNYYVAQEDALEARARDVLTHNEVGRHIRLNANDLFCSIYFGWLRARLREIIRNGRSRTRLERPFDWTDEHWDQSMDRVNRPVETELPTMLDHVIGMPETRMWGPAALRLPLDLSLCRTLFVEGRVGDRNRYTNLLFVDATRDLVLLIMLSTLVDIVKESDTVGLSLEKAYCGITLRDTTTMSYKQIILYRGPFPFRSAGVLRAYLEEIEGDGPVASEVIVVPCDHYELSPAGDDLAPAPVLAAEFQGDPVTIKRFIAPDRLLRSLNMGSLKLTMREELGMD